ncbi:MAG: GGDEF domain-containing protein [Marinospirillum sp.]|uniref:GGDEF domain-containing protein n=1 Tax=Marinospirillum sp. TaxID=2183934 RepID=UPI0019F14468|nr:GGDEF domain-containing protein [Marinospirillum sp.]MBE0507442.1 GGDEF domain-containing protein [Marinospirillum sp.]
MDRFFVFGSAHVSMIAQGTKALAPGRYSGMVTLMADGTALQTASTARWLNNASGLPDTDIEVVVPFFKRDAINQMILRDALELGIKAKVRPVLVDPPAHHVIAAQMDLKGSDGSLDIQVECSPLSRASFTLPQPSVKSGIALLDGRASLSTLNEMLTKLKDADFTTVVFFPRGENFHLISVLEDHIDAVVVERVLEDSEEHGDDREPIFAPSSHYLTAEWVRDDTGQFHVVYITPKNSLETEELMLPEDLSLEELQVGHLAAMLSRSRELSGRSCLPLAVHIEAFNKDMAVVQMQDHTMHLAPQFEALADKALRDQLTGLSNRHQAERLLCDVTQGCIAMIDLDYFKSVNDVYGHDFGDECLKYFAGVVQSVIRPSDMVFRWGGEEFMIYLDSRLDDAQRICQRVADQMKSITFADLLKNYGLEAVPEERKYLTASIGLTSIEDKSNWSEALSEADVAVYKAKSQGRDRIIVI